MDFLFRLKPRIFFGNINGAVEINVKHLRDHLDQLDKKKPTYIYCAKGMRGYLAFLILQQNGFTRLANLSGGYTVWNLLNKKNHVETTL